jgi:hypothetical protein
MVNRHPALFIPTAGLSGYANSTVMRAKLEAYAANGGVIVAFSQQYGREFALLPSPPGASPLSGYGYAEDANCRFNSSAIATFAPVLFSQDKDVLSLNVDGYFTAHPHDATPLLTRVVNGQPSMLTYPYGDGWVLATTTYADMARYMGQGTYDENVLIRDLSKWVLNPAIELDVYGKEDVVAIPISLTNNTAVPVVGEMLTVHDPEGTVRVGAGLTLPLAVGESRTTALTVPLTTTVDLGTPNGMWETHYTLYDERGFPVQTTVDAYNFAVSRLAPGVDGGYVYQGTPYGFSLTSDDEMYEYGETATFTFHVFNHTDQTRDFSVRYGLDHWGEGGFWGLFFRYPSGGCNLTVTPHDEGTCQWSRVVNGSHRVKARLVTGGQRVAYIERGYWLVGPKVDQEVRADRTYYTPVDTVELVLTTTNMRDRPREATTTLFVRDPHNSVVFSDVLTVTLPACCESVEQTVTLPHNLSYGTYRASTEVKVGGRVGDRDSTRIQVPVLQMHVASHLPPSLELNSPFSLTVTNPETYTSFDNTLYLTLTHPDGQAAWTATQVLGDLGAGQTVTPAFALDLEELDWGEYVLSYHVADGAGYHVGGGKVILPAQVTLSLDFDRAFYRVRDHMTLSLHVENSGRFTLEPDVELRIISAGISQQLPVTLTSGQSQTLVYTPTLPAGLGPGSHILIFVLHLDATPETNRRFRFYSFVVPPPDLEVRLDDLAVSATGNLTLTVGNFGGVDTSASYALELRDRSGWSIGAFQDSVPLVLAGGETPVVLELPPQAKTGPYTLEGTVTDAFDDQEVPLQELLTVAGLATSLSTTTDQEIYLTVDPITVTALLNNSGTPLVDGELSMQIVPAMAEQVEGYTLYNRENSGLIGDGIAAVAIDDQGNKWFGTNGSGLSVLSPDDTWTTYRGLSPDCEHMAVDAQGNAWCSPGWDGVSARWAADGSWTVYGTWNSGLTSNDVTAITVDAQDNVWFGHYISVSVRWAADGSWTTYPIEDDQVNDGISDLFVDAQGNVWVGRWQDGVSVRWAADGSWTTYTADDGLGSNYVSDIVADAGNNVWVSTEPVWDSGLQEYVGGGVSVRWAADGSWTTYTTDDGLERGRMRDLGIDAQGNVWVGKERIWDNSLETYVGGGVSMRQAASGAWVNYHREGLADNDIRALAVDAQGNLWVGTDYGGLSVRWAADGSWSTYTTDDGLSSNYISAVAIDAQDNVWVGTRYDGLSVRWATSGAWSTYTQGNGPPSDYISAVVVDAQNNVWVGPNGAAWACVGGEAV